MAGLAAEEKGTCSRFARVVPENITPKQAWLRCQKVKGATEEGYCIWDLRWRKCNVLRIGTAIEVSKKSAFVSKVRP